MTDVISALKDEYRALSAEVSKAAQANKLTPALSAAFLGRELKLVERLIALGVSHTDIVETLSERFRQ